MPRAEETTGGLPVSFRRSSARAPCPGRTASPPGGSQSTGGREDSLVESANPSGPSGRLAPHAEPPRLSAARENRS